LKIGKRFDKLADVYETEIRKKIPQYDELQKVFFSLVSLRRKEELDILDLGLGTGEVAGKLLQRYPNAKLVGIDASSRMIQRARLKLEDFSSRVKLIQSEFKKLPSLGKFDFIYSILAIHHLSAKDKQALFNNIWHMLRPDGRFLLMDVFQGSTSGLTNLYVRLTFPFDPEDKPSSLMEQLQWLSEAGFKRIDVAWKYFKLAAIIAFKVTETDLV